MKPIVIYDDSVTQHFHSSYFQKYTTSSGRIKAIAFSSSAEKRGHIRHEANGREPGELTDH